MKRLSIIFLLAVVSFLTACQKHDDTLQGTREDAWMYDVTLPVPIQFDNTGNDVMTKAEVSFDNLKEDEELSLGLLAVNNGDNNPNDSKDVFDWTLAGDDDFIWDSSSDYASELVYENKSVAFKNEPQYYPIVSDLSYDFYGFYPYKNDSGTTYKPLKTNTGIQIEYSLDGKQDILWAHAMGKKNFGVKGFNAKYIRAVRNGGADPDDYLPNLEFSHRLSKVVIQVISGEVGDDGQPVACEHIGLTRMNIQDQYTTASLVVAAGEGAGAGSFTGYEGQKSSISVYHVDDDDKTDFNRHKPIKDTETLGYAFILPTNSAAGVNVKEEPLKLHVYYALDDRPEAPKPMTIDLPYPDDTYLPGTIYTYRIVVYDAKPIEVKVILNPMEDYQGGYDGDNSNVGSDGTPDEYIDLITLGELILGADSGQSITTKLSTNSEGQWTVNLIDDDTEQEPTWLDLSIATGTGSAQLTFTTKSANTGTTPRTAKVEVTINGTNLTTGEFVITQDPPKITATQVKFGKYDAFSATTMIKPNFATGVGNFTIDVVLGDWLNQSPALTDNGDGTYTLTVEANGENALTTDQTGVIKITETNKEVSCDVNVIRPGTGSQSS